jgi:hypothetical protein
METQKTPENNENNEVNMWTVVKLLKKAIKSGDLSNMTEAAKLFATEDVVFDIDAIETLGFLKTKALMSDNPVIAEKIDAMIQLSQGDIESEEYEEAIETTEGQNPESNYDLKEKLDEAILELKAEEEKDLQLFEDTEHSFFDNVNISELKDIIESAKLIKRIKESINGSAEEIETESKIDQETLEQWRNAGLPKALIDEFEQKINSSKKLQEVYNSAFSAIYLQEGEISTLEELLQSRLSYQEQQEAYEQEEMNIIPETFMIIQEKGGRIAEILGKSVNNRTPHEQAELDLEITRVQKARLEEKRKNLD